MSYNFHSPGKLLVISPPPNCLSGYSIEYLKTILDLAEFNRWLDNYRGIRYSGVMCTGKTLNYATSKLVNTNCGPHGHVMSSWVVQGFLKGYETYGLYLRLTRVEDSRWH